MAGIIFNSEAPHSNDVSAIELRLRPYRSRWGNLGEIKLKKLTCLESLDIFISVYAHIEKIDTKKRPLSPSH